MQRVIWSCSWLVTCIVAAARCLGSAREALPPAFCEQGFSGMAPEEVELLSLQQTLDHRKYASCRRRDCCRPGHDSPGAHSPLGPLSSAGRSSNRWLTTRDESGSLPRQERSKARSRWASAPCRRRRRRRRVPRQAMPPSLALPAPPTCHPPPPPHHTQLYSALERQIQSDAFAEDLARSQHDLRQQAGAAAAAAADHAAAEVLAADWWELKEDGELRGGRGVGRGRRWCSRACADGPCRRSSGECWPPAPHPALGVVLNPLHHAPPCPQSASRQGSMCWWSGTTSCARSPPSSPST